MLTSFGNVESLLHLATWHNKNCLKMEKLNPEILESAQRSGNIGLETNTSSNTASSSKIYKKVQMRECTIARYKQILYLQLIEKVNYNIFWLG